MLDQWTSDHELGLVGQGFHPIEPWIRLVSTYGRRYAVAYLPLHTPPRGHGNLKAFRGDQEITPLANRSCAAATVESPLAFRIMHGEQGER